MNPAVIDAFLLLFPFVLSAALAPKVVKFCSNMLDIANERSSHTAPTPRGGGLLIAGLSAPLCLAAVYVFNLPHALFLNVLFLAGVFVAAIGWWDDKANCPAAVRLMVHMLAVGACLLLLPPVLPFLPFWADRVVVFLAWVWFLNLYNFMDGIDGIAASQAAFLGLALSVVVPFIKPIGLILAGVSIGFLRVNWRPAKIFMGDVGSTYLGFVLGGLLMFSASAAPHILLLPLATLTLLFSADTTYTLIKRLLKGHKPWQAHREHWYQRATQVGLSHAQVVKIGLGVNALLLVVAVGGVVLNLPLATLPLGLAIVAAAAYYIKYLENK